MSKKPSRYRSPDEKRIRKEIRALIRAGLKQDDLVRKLYELVDDERRRAYASMPIQVSLTNALENVRAAVQRW